MSKFLEINTIDIHDYDKDDIRTSKELINLDKIVSIFETEGNFKSEPESYYCIKMDGAIFTIDILPDEYERICEYLTKG